jgi:drug/metabolite transporter (DMT)-like permease
MLFGGVLGPVALLYGLVHSSAATASLLLNLEAVLTALLAWVVFKENADRRIVLGMLAIVAGGVLLAWPTGEARQDSWLGPLAISVACLCWAIDNNLTRHVSASDALFIAGSKGLVAGGVNTVLALALGMTLPGVATLLPAMTLGLLGYGVSLVMFVLALRGLGAARTGAYFSTAPFIGAAVALLLLGESASTSPLFWAAAALMGVGVWLHLTEQHGHQHTHNDLEHAHSHRHDAHHQHPHDAGWAGDEPHSHQHRHLPMAHSHHHFPDIHHRHEH